jgi:hypothetical protein
MSLTQNKLRSPLPAPRIASPVRIETEALDGIVEFKPFRAADSFNKPLPEAALPKVWRVVDSEVTSLIVPIFPKIQARFPRAEVENVIAFVRSNLHSNKARIVRSESAWGLATVNNSFLDTFAYVADFGVFALRPSVHDAMSIYLDLLDWAKSIGCAEFRYGSIMGANIEPFAKRIGYDHKHTLYSKVLK